MKIVKQYFESNGANGKRCITFLLLITIFFSHKGKAQNAEVKDTSYIQLAKEASEQFKVGNFVLADSFYTLSLNKHPLAETYFNRGLTRFRLSNKIGACLDWVEGSDQKDSLSRSMLDKYCFIKDTLKINADKAFAYSCIVKKGTMVRKRARFKKMVYYSIFREGEKEAAVCFNTLGDDTLHEWPLCLVFPGGTDAMLNFVSHTANYPSEIRDLNIQGKVFVSYVIEADGSLTNAQVVRGIHPLADAEALRIVRSFPRFKHIAICDKYYKTQKVKYTIPINFKLRN